MSTPIAHAAPGSVAPADNGQSPETRARRILYAFVVPVGAVLVWALASWLQLTPDYLLPSPQRVFLHALPQEVAKGKIFLDAAESIKRVVLGVLMATLTGVPIGACIGYWHGASRWTSTVMNFGRVLPPASLIPLAVIWFGIGDAPALFLIWFTCFWPVLLNAIVGVQGVEKILRDGALCLGANNRQIMTTVLLPGALPQIVGGVRLAFGLGWSVVVTSELLAVRNGVGYYIWNARLMFAMDQVFVGIVIIGIIGVVLDVLLRRIQRRVFRWQRNIVASN